MRPNAPDQNGKRQRALPPGLALGLAAYQAAWTVAAPFIARSPRMRARRDERLLITPPGPKADILLQAASGGEAYLAWEVLKGLGPGPEGRPWRVLATSITDQGLTILDLAASDPRVGPQVRTRALPLDRPSTMRRFLDEVDPRLVVLLETELWPGLLAAARERDIPVVVVNGRLTERSFTRYRLMPGLWRELGPSRVLAVSDSDAWRFAQLLGLGGVGRMQNIKFDRLLDQSLASATRPDDPWAGLLPEGALFVVLGSVRQEEEDAVQRMLKLVREALPEAVVGLFPRHLHRVGAWRERLKGTPCDLKSALAGPPSPGSVILWDRFGELGQAFARANAAFVGGSLAPLGGQNFLEPLEYGLRPVIGPHWSNFAWVGREAISQGLVLEAADATHAARLLAQEATSGRDRVETAALAHAYVAERRGGTEAACRLIIETLRSAPTEPAPMERGQTEEV